MKSELFMSKKYILSYLCFALACLMWAAEGDFEIAKKAYEKEEYKIAEVYLDNFLREEPHGEYIPDATYYLIRVYDKRGDFIKLFSSASLFLNNYKYDHRCKEILTILLKRLNEKEAFNVALDYIEKYDYLIDDYEILEETGYGLFEQNKKVSADYIFSLVPQSDTVKILRAGITGDFFEKREKYESLTGPEGRIYLIEFLLETGDTIEAYEVYRLVDLKHVRDNVLYRYAKISILFDKLKFTKLTKRLKKLGAYKNKSLLLEALSSGYLEELIIPGDQEECVLLIEYFKQDTVSRNLPDSVDSDLLISDSLLEDNIVSIKGKIGANYYLDSLYCDILLNNDRINEAFGVIAPYLKYQNTIDYTRKIRALKYYDEGKFDLAAKDIILSHNDEPEVMLVLAHSLTSIGNNAVYLYEEIVNTARDTLLLSQALKSLVKINFENKKYHDVIKHKFDILDNDTSLVRIFLYSLARTGKKRKADSIFRQYFTNKDYAFENYYGEYLIDKKKYIKANRYYDSIIHSTEDNLPDRLYYNWALIPFLQGKVDTALNRFVYYVDDFRGGKEYYKAAFKIATINYLRQEFDNAAYYYGLASMDELLRNDALQNQLICYKKSGNWDRTVETGKKILQSITDDKELDIQFEIGYAYLRSGNAKDAIEYLKNAASSNSIPEYHYWLGESYLAKADFIRALYQYQKIIELFPKDEMWTPTAEYKTGIVFEFMDEFDEAKRVYKEIIKKRGIGDTWGTEAQKRLETIQ